MYQLRPGRGIVALALLSTTLVVASCNGCSNGPTNTNAGATNTASNAPSNTATTNTSGPRLPDANSNKTIAEQAPLAKGASVRVEARVVTIPCYRDNPGMTRENLDVCTKEASDAGMALVFLGTDGVVYVPEIAPELTSNYAPLIGRDVLLDGNVHEEAKNLAWPGVTVKRMEIVRARDKHVRPTQPGANANTNQGAAAPKAPAKS
jgi:hypothetical protein